MPPYMTLGEALYEKGFDCTGFYPEDAFAADPAHPKVVFGKFDPSVPYVDPHDAVGLQVMEARYGKGVPKAKGSPPGAWHGRESTWQIEEGLTVKYLGLVASFDLDHGWSKEDLKYVCNKDGLFAYQWLIITHDGLVASEVKPKNGGSASTKTPLDQRAEELRHMAAKIHGEARFGRLMDFYSLIDEDQSWVYVKPFVIAALAAYRKIMED